MHSQLISEPLQLISNPLGPRPKALQFISGLLAADKQAAGSETQGSAVHKQALGVDKEVTENKTQGACMQCMCLRAKRCKRS